MIDQLVLSLVLLREPKCARTSEQDEVICFYSNSKDTEVAKVDTEILYATVMGSSEQTVIAVTDFSPQQDFSLMSTAEKFQRLAAQWSEETSHISSSTRAISNSNYQAIIKLGWNVVPLMLQDLQNNRGYWYPALSAITGIRPFDRKDAGNSLRMTEAWLSWGRKKELI